jgi:homoserine O-succinyltransferase/O-acetyltransferase
MPLTILTHRSSVPPRRDPGERHRAADPIVVGLVNNMPDSALEATEAQFSRLLRTAAGPLAVELRLGYLPEVPRGADVLEHVSRAYWPIDELLQQPLDGLIVTGMEPKAARLADEPYWHRFQLLLDWAETHTPSSIWSCLAAHAAVQILDGIERRRLEQKRFGVFEHPLLEAHPLARGLQAPVFTPHSRWNEVPVAKLRTAGYVIVSSSPENGADLFVRQGRSLLVFFQGHPEYEEASLLKEYRRDVGRFLRGQQPHYPLLPSGYLSEEATELLSEFGQQALVRPSADLLTSFPMDAVSACVQSTWSAAAVTVYRNWLSLIAAAKKPQSSGISLEV